MTTEVPFRLRIEGGDADRHLLPAYDGLTALAGFSLSLSLVTNYCETGKIRRRGNFPGRTSVKLRPLERGSIVSEFTVLLAGTAALGTAVLSDVDSREFLYDLFKRTIDRNLGNRHEPQTEQLAQLEKGHGGTLEALVAATEPAVKQSHSVIGDGAEVINIFGGRHNIAAYNGHTKMYVEGSYEDGRIREKDVSVASFNVNSGYGGVFDADEGRVVPIQLTKDTLSRAKNVLTWGLDQYANATSRRITLRYYKIMALDDTVKKYIVVDAQVAQDL